MSDPTQKPTSSKQEFNADNTKAEPGSEAPTGTLWDVSMPKPNAAGHPTLTIEAATAEEAVTTYLAKLKLSPGARPTAKPAKT